MYEPVDAARHQSSFQAREADQDTRMKKTSKSMPGEGEKATSKGSARKATSTYQSPQDDPVCRQKKLGTDQKEPRAPIQAPRISDIPQDRRGRVEREKRLKEGENDENPKVIKKNNQERRDFGRSTKVSQSERHLV